MLLLFLDPLSLSLSLSLSVSVSLDELDEELLEELEELEELELDEELLEELEHDVSYLSVDVDLERDERLEQRELHELRLFDDEFLDEPLNLQRRPLECPRSPLPLSYPLSSYHSRIFKTLFSLAVTVKLSRSLFLSSVSTVPITS